MRMKVGICSERSKYSCAASASVLPGERHDALIALHPGARIDGHGQMAAAQQRFRRRAAVHGLGKVFAIEAGITAQVARRAVMHHQEAHRPLRLRLQNELAVEFQRGAEHRGKRDRLAQEQQNRLGIGVLGQNLIDRGAKPDEPAARPGCLQLERENVVAELIRAGSSGPAVISVHRTHSG